MRHWYNSTKILTKARNKNSSREFIQARWTCTAALTQLLGHSRHPLTTSKLSSHIPHQKRMSRATPLISILMTRHLNNTGVRSYISDCLQSSLMTEQGLVWARCSGMVLRARCSKYALGMNFLALCQLKGIQFVHSRTVPQHGSRVDMVSPDSWSPVQFKS